MAGSLKYYICDVNALSESIPKLNKLINPDDSATPLDVLFEGKSNWIINLDREFADSNGSFSIKDAIIEIVNNKFSREIGSGFIYGYAYELIVADISLENISGSDGLGRFLYDIGDEFEELFNGCGMRYLNHIDQIVEQFYLEVYKKFKFANLEPNLPVKFPLPQDFPTILSISNEDVKDYMQCFTKALVSGQFEILDQEDRRTLTVLSLLFSAAAFKKCGIIFFYY